MIVTRDIKLNIDFINLEHLNDFHNLTLIQYQDSESFWKFIQEFLVSWCDLTSKTVVYFDSSGNLNEVGFVSPNFLYVQESVTQRIFQSLLDDDEIKVIFLQSDDARLLNSIIDKAYKSEKRVYILTKEIKRVTKKEFLSVITSKDSVTLVRGQERTYVKTKDTYAFNLLQYLITVNKIEKLGSWYKHNGVMYQGYKSICDLFNSLDVDEKLVHLT